MFRSPRSWSWSTGNNNTENGKVRIVSSLHIVIVRDNEERVGVEIKKKGRQRCIIHRGSFCRVRILFSLANPSLEIATRVVSPCRCLRSIDRCTESKAVDGTASRGLEFASLAMVVEKKKRKGWLRCSSPTPALFGTR